MPMIMKVASSTGSTYVSLEGVKKVADPEKRMAYSYIIKKQ